MKKTNTIYLPINFVHQQQGCVRHHVAKTRGGLTNRRRESQRKNMTTTIESGTTASSSTEIDIDEDDFSELDMCGPHCTWRKQNLIRQVVRGLLLRHKRHLFRLLRMHEEERKRRYGCVTSVGENVFFTRYGITAARFAACQIVKSDNRRRASGSASAKTTSGGKKRKSRHSDDNDNDDDLDANDDDVSDNEDASERQKKR